MTSTVATGLSGPAHVPPGRDRCDDRRAERGQPEAIPAVQRVQVAGAAARAPGTAAPTVCASAIQTASITLTIQPARITNGLADGAGRE